MSKRQDIDLIRDILECIKRIEMYTVNMNYGDFQKDLKTQDAVIRNLEILGEAAKSLSTIVKESHPEILWKQIAGTRDKLIHDYFGVNIDIVWGISKNDLPDLQNKIVKLLQELGL
ncbi:DUF86 domain-containing protein [candidate division KSB1 bacterium]|nr:DUF86 domain-containing protein [candidate division KSB1 bacterium]